MKKLLIISLLSFSFVLNSFCGGNQWSIAYHAVRTAFFGTATVCTTALMSSTMPSMPQIVTSAVNNAGITLTTNEVKQLAQAVLKK